MTNLGTIAMPLDDACLAKADRRFWAMVEKTDSCWLWQGYRTPKGYGKFNLAPRHSVRSHRYSYETLVGPIPEGAEITHRCGTRNCVNPDHLVLLDSKVHFRSGSVATDPVARFWSKVDKQPGGCWIWTAAKNPQEYGHFSDPSFETQIAHRIAYELEVGPIPADMLLHHRCKVPSCVNPDHLEPLTSKQHRPLSRLATFNGPTWTRTHCEAGHPFDEKNTQLFRLHGKLHRRCRLCQVAVRQRSKLRRKGESIPVQYST